MAVLAAAQLLDELMGRNRNVAPDEEKKELHWEDPELCAFFNVKFCPHDLFVNTRADLGACEKIHDEEARRLFNEEKPLRKLPLQEDFLRFCNGMVNEVERKIIKGKNRLALNGNGRNIEPASSVSPTGGHSKNSEKMELLTDRINDLEAEAEQAGTDGNVEQAQGLMRLCDQLKEERDSLRKQTDPGHWSVEVAAAQEKLMEVCEVCGAFLIVGDAQQRIDDHLSGKQHVGYSKLRAAVQEITAVVLQAREERRFGKGGGLGSGDEKLREREKERDRRRLGREKSGERSRSEHRSDKEKDAKREKDKGHREAHRERDRDRKCDRKHGLDRHHDRDRRHHSHHRR